MLNESIHLTINAHMLVLNILVYYLTFVIDTNSTHMSCMFVKILQNDAAVSKNSCIH